jgi:hypothetical protein
VRQLTRILVVICREMLEQSSSELKVTVDELERRIDNIDEEG